MMSKGLKLKALFSTKAQEKLEEDEEQRQLQRTASQSSYMKQSRKIFVNMVPHQDLEDSIQFFSTNRIRTAKYTPLTFVPKNLFEQFRNVANLYFLFLVVLQCIPLFGVTEPAVSAMPLLAILLITGIKDAVEDFKRNMSDQKVNGAKALVLSHWTNVNVPPEPQDVLYHWHVFLGFFSMLAGAENRYSHVYRMSTIKDSPIVKADIDNDNDNNSLHPSHTFIRRPSSLATQEGGQPVPSDYPQYLDPPPSIQQKKLPLASKKILNTVRQRSDTLRSEISNIFKHTNNDDSISQQRRKSKKFYRPGTIPHSVLYRNPSPMSGYPNQVARPPSSTVNTMAGDIKCADMLPGDPPAPNCKSWWQVIQWQDVKVGDYVMLRNDDDVPADMVVLSSSEKDSICCIETQNLDGETNLKIRQGLTATKDIGTVHDCERARFYLECEPPHPNIYQFSGVLRWNIERPVLDSSDDDDDDDDDDDSDNNDDNPNTGEATEPSDSANDIVTPSSPISGQSSSDIPMVSHQKTEAITQNNILLRGCVLRNTGWIIGMVVYTGNDTKIMLNTGRTPSKRSRLARKTNPHVIANFVILAILCLVTAILSSVFFKQGGSSRSFDFGIQGPNASWLGFVTFWVALILYQNIVPISLYISVEIVKTFAAYFIHADIDMYHEQTDTACLPRTWNISDDLGQIEYVFSDKTGTLTQNVMEYRKCTIGGIEYGLGETEATYGSYKRDSGHQENDINGSIVEKTTTVEEMEEYKKQMYDLQAKLFKNPYVGNNPTFIDPKIFQDLSKDNDHRSSIIHFFSTLALCHTAIAERSDKNQDSSSTIEYKAQSPDEAALVSTARDIGFTFLGREADLLSVNIMGEIKTFDLLNVLEFNSTRKRMSVIIRPRDGSNRIVLLSKGADSVIYERLCTNFGTQHDLESKQQNIRDDTSTHLEGFATEGLRTLCLAYRFIAANEYEEWNKRFMSASSSIYGRDEKVDEVCEEIESDLLLMGGTAIEDRLQEGVPETIALLAQSGIKLWVLTGDKTETAINIGYACNLITTDMELLIVKSSTREGTLERMKEVLDQIDREIGDDTNNDNDVGGTGSSGDCKLFGQDRKARRRSSQPRKYQHNQQQQQQQEEEEEENDQQRPHHQRVQQGQSVKRALVIDGTTLKYALEPKNKYYLLRLGMQCASVICCRVSPKQKAQVVTLVKRGLDVMTLAIGDGANDVSMIQEANVGVGISGVEGRQAVMSSDYAIAQFRYLQKLLLVHGRWSYLRTAEMIMGFFFKNIIWTFVLLWYQIFCQFTGTMMFDYALVTLYNLIFTSLPIIFLGIWDQDLNASTSLLYPELYRMGLRDDKFKTVRFWMNVIDSIFQSSVCFFFPYMLLVAGAVDPSGYDQNGTYEIGTIIASYAVIVANLFVAFSLYSYTWIQLLIISLSIAVYYLFTAVYSQFISFNFRGQVKLYGTGLYWLVLLLTVVTCFIPRTCAKYYGHQYRPYDNDIIRERELILHNRRHLEQQEEKSSKETIQPSLPTDKDKSTTTTLGPDPF
ncbi:uncharacterized protein BX664DRAFT_355545 [Halteromyces radiatus]|uniref:uncharacterized protein n=1 Tax=Halteromyces radiatus TaxID=101107 RepID=UPI00221EC32B|nr:uncharacterized protein BX664DRAFT_355545 [Halteromyces radiatus]KAI8100209.1 hypothetical protein BX664DRAFT_355545 [Halteromyces radiatus]